MPVSSSRTAGTGSTVCLVVVFVCFGQQRVVKDGLILGTELASSKKSEELTNTAKCKLTVFKL